jgi:hypothetical protein
MCGNKKIRMVCLFFVAVCVLSAGILPANATERRLPEKTFRFGIECEPGLKSVFGEAFQFDYGLVFKIQERISIIPRFGLQYYQYDTTYNYFGMGDTSETRHRSAFNICLTLRYEFVKRLTLENTRYEYDVEKHEFNHYYYARAFRPYVQLHVGSFTGFGGGVSYYVLPQIGLGIGVDMGVNWIALANRMAGFAIIAPKAVVSILFN